MRPLQDEGEQRERRKRIKSEGLREMDGPGGGQTVKEEKQIWGSGNLASAGEIEKKGSFSLRTKRPAWGKKLNLQRGKEKF